MILPISLPSISRAADSGAVLNTEEDYPLNVALERDGNTVHITATSTDGNITDLKYVHQYIDTDNASYFEEEHDDIYTFNITPAQTIEETFELDGYGSYTVYAKNEKGYAFLARLTVNDPNDMPQITLAKEEENPLILNIDVTSNKNTITKLKIAKKEHINDNIDFSIQGTDIEFIESNHVSVRYTGITEEGLYVVYAEDSAGNRVTNQIYVANQNTPISVDITNGTNAREVNLSITDAICNIVSVKVARSSEVTDFEDFENIEGLPITEGQTVNVSYTAPEDDTYVFYIEDEAGYKVMTQRRITTEENTMHITIEQDENSPGNLTITATNTICNIVEMKVAIGDDIDMDYFENNGELISIEPGREVVGMYTVQENCTINVHIRDEQGYTYMYTRNLIGIDDPEPEPNNLPTITLTQNTENPKQIDVRVLGDKSNIDEVKWAKGEQNTEYFATNGTRIGQDKVGISITTEFAINDIGTYTVYARDENGNETVKTIEITNIDEVPPTEEDTTPPQVNDIEDNAEANIADGMEESFRTEELLFRIKKIGLNLAALMELNLKNESITGVQVYFLVYILRHHPQGTYLTELCREIGVSKPTLSALIKKMREKGYLYFLADPDDVRKKKVLPTAKLIAEGDKFMEKADQMESEICSALDRKEQTQLWDLEQKLINQLARMEHEENNQKNRQEVYLQ